MRRAPALSELFAVAIVLIAGPARAQNYNLPWCATLDNDGTTQCAYYTQQQCLETLSGIGGQCTPNPSPAAPTLAPTAPPPAAGLGSPLNLDPGLPPGLDGSAGPGPRQAVVIPNNLFTAAGFVVKYATTPEKRAILRSLPPDKLVKRTKDGILYYVYADAARCNCAYVGTAQAYAAYQNAPNDPNVGGGDQPLSATQMIDSDVEAPYIPDNNVYSGVDSVLGSGF